jgi:hypothetical protein
MFKLSGIAATLLTSLMFVTFAQLMADGSASPPIFPTQQNWDPYMTPTRCGWSERSSISAPGDLSTESIELK